MRLCCFGIIAFLISGSLAFGDGCYIPERAVKKIPDIVAQRAALSWKNGEETLIIESALDSLAQQLGWIIPVPAVPTTIEKSTPGSLKTLDFCIQPRITHDLYPLLKATVVVLLVVNLLTGTWLFKRRHFSSLALLLVVIFLLNGLLLSAGDTSRTTASRSSGVRVEKSATVGSYDVSILRLDRPDGLDAWLTENGFAALPDAAGPIVADYVSRGWVFAAIKLTRNETGENAPHPIKMVFTSKEPIYPMKLTALAGGRPAFELFVIGEDRASCDALPEEFCDRFSQQTNEESAASVAQISFHGQSSNCNVGHRAICPLMWDGCVITKFSGSIDAKRITDDIHFTWAPFKAHQDHYFTRSGASDVALVLFFAMVGIGNILCMRDYARGFVQPVGFGSYCVRRLLLVGMVASLVAAGVFTLLPKLDNGEIQVGRFRRCYVQSISAVYKDWLEQNPEVLKGTEAQIAAFLISCMEHPRAGGSPMLNPVMGGEFELEDSPGNLTIEKKSGEVRLQVYQADGSALTTIFALPVNGVGASPN
jgi:hypothetical protein